MARAPDGQAAERLPARSFRLSGGTPTPITPPIETSALLVMDFQPKWLKTIPGSETTVERAKAALDAARSLGMLVAYTQVAFSEADYAAVPESSIIFSSIARPWGDLDSDAPGIEIDPVLAPLDSEKVVVKTRVSAFERTDLDGWLRGMEVDTLLLAGISTSGVTLSTVCDGADLDYRLIVLEDACADQVPRIQEVLMSLIFPQRATVETVDSVFGRLKG